MQVLGLPARPRRRGLPKDEGTRSRIADNVLDRQFTAEAPNQKWVADFTYIWTAEGWLFVAVVLDLFSRRVVGWSCTEPPRLLWRLHHLREWSHEEVDEVFAGVA